MSGAFQGVTIAVTPAGSQVTWLRWPRVSKSGWRAAASRWSAKKRKFIATRGMTPRRWLRSSEPLSRVSTWARSSMRFSTPSATRCRIAARSAGGSRGPGRERRLGRGHGGVDLGLATTADPGDRPGRRAGRRRRRWSRPRRAHHRSSAGCRPRLRRRSPWSWLPPLRCTSGIRSGRDLVPRPSSPISFGYKRYCRPPEASRHVRQPPHRDPGALLGVRVRAPVRRAEHGAHPVRGRAPRRRRAARRPSVGSGRPGGLRRHRAAARVRRRRAPPRRR